MYFLFTRKFRKFLWRRYRHASKMTIKSQLYAHCFVLSLIIITKVAQFVPTDNCEFAREREIKITREKRIRTSFDRFGRFGSSGLCWASWASLRKSLTALTADSPEPVNQRHTVTLDSAEMAEWKYGSGKVAELKLLEEFLLEPPPKKWYVTQAYFY